MTARPRAAEGEFRVSSPSEEFLLGLISFHLLTFLSPFNRRLQDLLLTAGGRVKG